MERNCISLDSRYLSVYTFTSALKVYRFIQLISLQDGDGILIYCT